MKYRSEDQRRVVMDLVNHLLGYNDRLLSEETLKLVVDGYRFVAQPPKTPDDD